MGCVNWSLRFFRGEVTRENMERARIAARLEVQTLERRYRSLGWEECIGASGTVLAVEQILRANQWTDGGITEKGLRKLRKALIEVGLPADFPSIPGLEAERANVIAGGVAILDALFDGLEIERMDVSQGALREGVIYDLLGRIRHEDVRDKTIRRFMERHQVDMEQAGRVQRTALALFQQAHEGLEVDPSLGEHFLVWSSRLHEIGLSIGYPGYHKHGAYIVEHSDMPGFSREDQVMLAALIEAQRRKFPPTRIEALAPSQRRIVERLALPLRLAVLLERSRGQSKVPRIGIEARKGGYMLDFPKGWLDDNPLTRADLEQEAARLVPAGIVIAILHA
jgi:exopolyphosphatase/guanosine-5'-triphosphate,3'-diphosphate pyrophosphatase